MRIRVLEAPHTWKEYLMQYLVLPVAGIVLTVYVGLNVQILLQFSSRGNPTVEKVLLGMFVTFWLIGITCAIWPIVSALVRRTRKTVAAG